MAQEKILIVDDEVVVAEDIRRQLRSLGYVVVGVVASVDGKRLAREYLTGESADPGAAGVALAELLLPLAKTLLPDVPDA